MWAGYGKSLNLFVNFAVSLKLNKSLFKKECCGNDLVHFLQPQFRLAQKGCESNYGPKFETREPTIC